MSQAWNSNTLRQAQPQQPVNTAAEQARRQQQQNAFGFGSSIDDGFSDRVTAQARTSDNNTAQARGGDDFPPLGGSSEGRQIGIPQNSAPTIAGIGAQGNGQLDMDSYGSAGADGA